MRADTSVADAIAASDRAHSPLMSAPVPGLVWAFRIHSDGTPESLPIDQPIPLSHDGLLWLHFNLADARALQWLTTANFQVPALARGLLLSKDTYQQLHTVDDCVYGVISDLLRDVGEATEDTGYLRFVMTEQILVSGRHHRPDCRQLYPPVRARGGRLGETEQPYQAEADTPGALVTCRCRPPPRDEGRIRGEKRSRGKNQAA